MAETIDDLRIEIKLKTDQLTRRLRGAEKQIQRFTRNVGGATNQARTNFEQLASSIFTVRNVLAALSAIGVFQGAKGLIKASAEFETNLVNIGKTADLSGNKLTELGRKIQDVAEEIPIATNELLRIGVAAGQLGVRGTENIGNFVKTLGRLQLATDIIGESGAKSIARILTITAPSTGDAFRNIDRFGSALVDLGNSAAATESEIVEVATKVAQATAVFKVNAQFVLGLSTAMREMGINAEIGGTQIGLAFQAINKALFTSSKTTDVFVKLMGKSLNDLQTQFKTEPGTLFQDFLEALQSISRTQVPKVLGDMELTGARMFRVLGPLSQRFALVSGRIEQANKAFDENVALVKEADRVAATFAGRMQVVRNSLGRVAKSIGDEINPAIATLSETFSAKLTKDIDGTKDSFFALAAGASIFIATQLPFFVLDAVRAMRRLFGATDGASRSIGGVIRSMGRIRSLPALVLKISSSWLGLGLILAGVTTAVIKFARSSKVVAEATENSAAITISKWDLIQEAIQLAIDKAKEFIDLDFGQIKIPAPKFPGEEDKTIAEIIADIKKGSEIIGDKLADSIIATGKLVEDRIIKPLEDGAAAFGRSLRIGLETVVDVDAAAQEQFPARELIPRIRQKFGNEENKEFLDFLGREGTVTVSLFNKLFNETGKIIKGVGKEFTKTKEETKGFLTFLEMLAKAKKIQPLEIEEIDPFKALADQSKAASANFGLLSELVQQLEKGFNELEIAALKSSGAFDDFAPGFVNFLANIGLDADQIKNVGGLLTSAFKTTEQSIEDLQVDLDKAKEALSGLKGDELELQSKRVDQLEQEIKSMAEALTLFKEENLSVNKLLEKFNEQARNTAIRSLTKDTEELNLTLDLLGGGFASTVTEAEDMAKIFMALGLGTNNLDGEILELIQKWQNLQQELTKAEDKTQRLEDVQESIDQLFKDLAVDIKILTGDTGGYSVELLRLAATLDLTSEELKDFQDQLEELDALFKEVEGLQQFQEDLDKFRNIFESTFDDIVDSALEGKINLIEIFTSLSDAILKEIIRLTVIKPIMDSLFGEQQEGGKKGLLYKIFAPRSKTQEESLPDNFGLGGPKREDDLTHAMRGRAALDSIPIPLPVVFSENLFSFKDQEGNIKDPTPELFPLDGIDTISKNAKLFPIPLPVIIVDPLVIGEAPPIRIPGDGELPVADKNAANNFKLLASLLSSSTTGGGGGGGGLLGALSVIVGLTGAFTGGGGGGGGDLGTGSGGLGPGPGAFAPMTMPTFEAVQGSQQITNNNQVSNNQQGAQTTIIIDARNSIGEEALSASIESAVLRAEPRIIKRASQSVIIEHRRDPLIFRK